MKRGSGTMNTLELAIWAAILVIVSVALGPAAWREVTLDRREPVVAFTRTEAINTPISGGNVVVRYWRRYQRNDCSVCSSRAVYDSDGVLHDIPNSCHPSYDPSGEYSDISNDVSMLGNGHHILTVHLTYSCPGDLEFEYPTLLTPFRITREFPLP